MVKAKDTKVSVKKTTQSKTQAKKVTAGKKAGRVNSGKKTQASSTRQRKIKIPVSDKARPKTKTNTAKAKSNPSATKKPKTENTETVILPAKVTDGLLNRLKLYEIIFNEKTSRFIYKTTATGGYVFIFFGLVMAVFLLNSNNQSNYSNNLLALTCDSSNDCELIDSIQVYNEDLTSPQPTLSFTGDYPDNPTEDFTGKISTENVSTIELYLINQDTRDKARLKTNTLEAGVYGFTVYVSNIDTGTYEFKVNAHDLAGEKVYTFSGPAFTVQKEPQTEEIEEDKTTDTITNETQTDNEASVDSEIIATTTTESVVVEEENENEISEPSLKLSLEDNSLSQTTKHLSFIVTTQERVSFVEVYTQSRLSQTPYFLGLAEKIDSNQWRYVFAVDSLPAAEYNFFARTKINDKLVDTNTVSFDTAPYYEQFSYNQPTDSQESEILTEKVNRDLQTTPTTNNSSDTNLVEQRKEYYSTLEEEDTLKKSEDEEKNDVTVLAREEADSIMKTVEAEINDLLQRYASTLQTKDENLIRVMEEEITAYKSQLLLELDTNPRTKDIAGEVAKVIDAKFTVLKERVRHYENIISTKSELAFRDTDQDGISDFDEETIYNTDKNNPDTDNDGVLDGVEIARGFDPLNVDKTATINFESAKEVSFIDEENLLVTTVRPVIEMDDNGKPVITKAEIRGKGRPNSFVTLYIYSSPTIVTVKTNDEGDFVYTFDKELSDGKHEVYVALTDNAGGIIARSSAFEFTKTAQAFVSTGTGENVLYPNTTQTSEEILSLYNITAAMGIVSLGLILLLLVRNMRQEEEFKPVIHEKVTQIT